MGPTSLSCLVSLSDFFMLCITADGNVSLKKVMSDVTAVTGKLKVIIKIKILIL